MNRDNSTADKGIGFFCPCLIMPLLIPLDSCSMCHVGAAVFGTWIFPSNRSYQWKHLKVQSLSSFYDLLLHISTCRKTGTIYTNSRSNTGGTVSSLPSILMCTGVQTHECTVGRAVLTTYYIISRDNFVTVFCTMSF